jgi:hypothetical protein
MNTKDIRNALKSTLDDASIGIPIDYPNTESAAGIRPRVELSIPSVEQIGGTLKGNELQREEGTLLAVVVVEQGQGENAGLDYADSVADAFPEGSRISITGGTIYITARPSVRGGYKDEADYRVPVAIRYSASNI